MHGLRLYVCFSSTVTLVLKKKSMGAYRLLFNIQRVPTQLTTCLVAPASATFPSPSSAFPNSVGTCLGNRLLKASAQNKNTPSGRRAVLSPVVCDMTHVNILYHTLLLSLPHTDKTLTAIFSYETQGLPKPHSLTRDEGDYLWPACNMVRLSTRP